MKKKDATNKKNPPVTGKPQPKAVKNFAPNPKLALVAAFACVLLYANTFHNGYVLDDKGIIQDNQYVQQGLKGIGGIFGSDVWHFQNINLGYYRPLSLVTFAVEHQFFGNNPYISHIINVLLFALTGFLVCLLLMHIFRQYSPFFSLAIALLFVAHPIHTEVVANIKSRDEILSFLNLIAALYFLLKAYSHKVDYKMLAFSALFFYLALLSKETAFAGIFIAPLVIYFATSKNFINSLFVLSVFAVVFGVFQLQKYLALGTLNPTIKPDIISYPYTDPAIKLPTMLLIFGWCIKLALVPFPLAYSYAYNQIPPVTWASPFVWVALIAGLGVLYVAVKGLKTWQQYSFGILFFLVALAPAMGFVLLRGGILAERFLYAPVLGLCVVVVWALSKYGKADFSSALTVNSVLRQPLFAIPFIALLLLYSGETVERNFDWYSNFALFTHDANVVENSCQAQLHSGTSYIEAAIRDHGQKERVEAFNAGMQHLNKALNINPHLAEAIYEKARAFHYLVGNTDSAVLYYNQSIMEGPTYALSYFGLGQLYENLGKQELASYYFNKGVQIDPYNQEGLAARDEHRKKTGLDVKTFPSQSNDIAGADDGADKGFDYYNNKGTDFGKRGDFANGAKYLEKAVELNPTSAEAWVNLSICQAGLKQYSKGIASLEKVLEMYPNNESAIRNIVVMYDFTGQKAKADEYREKLKALGN